MLLRYAVAIFFATVAFCGCVAAWCDEPPRPVLRVFCFDACVYCKVFDEDCKVEPLKSAIARFELVKFGQEDGPRHGVKRYPTFMVPVVGKQNTFWVQEGYPDDRERGLSRAQVLTEWLKGK